MKNIILALAIIAAALASGCAPRMAWRGGGSAVYQQPYGPQPGFGQAQGPYGAGYGIAPGASAMPAYYVSEYAGTSYDPRAHPAVATHWQMREALRPQPPPARYVAPPPPPPPEVRPPSRCTADLCGASDDEFARWLEQRREMGRLQRELAD